ncbi:MAG: asparagine synthase (glutamine-hydrolyzing) [Bacteroidota bacterium]
MCGITGFFSTQFAFSSSDLRRMTYELSHRGPDAEGFFEEGPVGLGHRRLSILDLSAGANQPMFSQNDRYVIVYNGEVYNFQEIKDQLPHIAFCTTSDTEVILEAFAQWGNAFALRLNGMFAIAIYDRQTERLSIFRGRMGIKPLYYYWDGRKFAFASELKALTCLSQIPTVINSQAIPLFLQLGYIPVPHSIYQNIYKMPAGCLLTVNEKDGMAIEEYWNVNMAIEKQTINEEELAISKLDELLYASVKDQLISDVPVGIFLSGGIDSSLVATQAVRASTTKVNTFSIGFKTTSRGVNRFSEAEYARVVAQALGTNHHEFLVSIKEAQLLIEELGEVYDEPFADSSAVPTMLVSKLAREKVTVALSGDGGDELFLGYGMYQWAERLHTPFNKLARKPIRLLLGQMPGESYFKAHNMFSGLIDESIYQHIFSQEQGFFNRQEVNALLINRNYPKQAALLPYNEFIPPAILRSLTASEKQSLFDLKYYLQDDLLVKVDRASMHYGLEARVPMLDNRLIDFALNLSPKLKYKNGERKYLLKQVLYKHLPPPMFDRPKQGFAIPLNHWLQTDLKYLIEDHLNESVIKQFKVVNYEAVRKLKERYLKGESYLYHRIWVLIVLHQFLLKNKAANPTKVDEL